MQTSDSAADELRSLRRTIRDLVALSTLPAVWTGSGRGGIAQSLADVLVKALDLDLIYIRLRGTGGDDVIEVVGSRHPTDVSGRAQAVGQALARVLDAAAYDSSPLIPDPLRRGTLRTAVVRFGHTGDYGVLVAGAERADFPTRHDRLLLSVSANQTAVVIQRKQTEQALQKEREWLSVTLASIGDAVIATDTEGRVTFLNGVAQSLTGWANEEATGRPLGAVFPIVNEQTRRPVENPVEKVLREGVVVGLANHTVLTARDGTEHPIDDSAAPIRDQHGKVVGVVLVFRDVSEQRRAEREQADRSRLVALRADVSAALATMQPLPTVLRQCGEALVRHLGVAFARIWMPGEREDLLELRASAGLYTHLDGPHSRVKVGEFKIGRIAAGGRPLVTNAVPNDPNISDPEWAKREGMVAFAGYPLRIEDRVVGVLAMFSRSPLSDAVLKDLPTLAEAMAQYIDRKRAEDRLREETRVTETLHRIGSLLAAELDLDKLVQTVTDEATGLTGAQFGAFFYNVVGGQGERYTLYTISGVPREAFERFPMPRNTAIFDPTFRGEGPVRQDDVTRDPRYGKNAPYHGMPEGHLPVRSYLAVPVISRSGEVLGALFFGHSEPGVFTERHERIVVGIAAQAAVAIDNARLYRQAREQAERLREADRRKDEFLATLAHELRNPLAPIRTGLELMRVAGDDRAMVEEIRTTMEGQARHLVRLVDDLLDVSRITSGKVVLRKERVELSSVVRSAVEATRTLMDEAGHDLSVTLPSQPLHVDGDPTRLAQILSNLLTNAARYTENGGRIRLAAERQGGEVVLTVSDTGIGIPAEMLESIFDMFRQVDQSLERSHSGLGIGLTLVKRLVEMHGGSVEARSEGPGKGSIFTVRLPLPAGPEQVPPPTSDEGAAAPGKLRILVVDDNKDAAKMLGMIVKMLGNEVRTAHDGLEAVDVAAQFRPDVVLMDLGMPKLNGYEAARRMREQPWAERMLLVALTGWGQEEDRQRTKEAGFDHHLVKPVEPAALRKLLAECVPLPK